MTGNKAVKIVVWGLDSTFDSIINLLRYESIQGNIHVIAIVCNNGFHNMSIDGIPIISSDELKNTKFDYIISTSQNNFETANSMFPNHVIKSKVLLTPLFELKNYIKLYRSDISIVSDDCWGAYVYNYLGLQFRSPFILASIKPDDYLTLLTDLKGFLTSPIECWQDFPDCPTGYLEYNGKRVLINFTHCTDFSSARIDWIRRIERFNYNNYFIKMTLHSDTEAQMFSKLPYTHKIGFFYRESLLDDVFYLTQWGQKESRVLPAVNNNFKSFVLRSFDSNYNGVIRPLNLIRLLLGEKDYQRFSV